MSISWDDVNRLLPAYDLLSADRLAIVSGVLIFLISFCGCCGAWLQKKYLLISYLTLITLIMVLEIAAGTLGYFYRHEIKETLHQELMLGIKTKYSLDDANGLASTWNKIQVSFNCCGVDHYQDWHQISAWSDKDWVPESCCMPLPINETDASSSSSSSTTAAPLTSTVASTTTTTTAASTSAASTSNINDTQICGRDAVRDEPRFKKHGCFKKIRHWILEHLHVVGITCIIFAFIQFFSIVAALLVVCTMDYRRGRPRKGSSRPTYDRVPQM